MKRPVIILAVLAILATGGWFAWRSLPARAPDRWLGYVEGEALNIAVPTGGVLARRGYARGDRVVAGDTLFTLNPVISDAETERLEAQLAAAQAQLQSLGSARQRPAEIGVSRARQASARVEIEQAHRQYQRYAVLARKGFVTRAQLDAAKAAIGVAEASYAQARAEEASGRLTIGRTEDVQAARANIATIEAALKAQKQRRAEISPVASASGVIEQTFFNAGEAVGANQPILALIPDDQRKIRFFVPQDQIARLRTGSDIGFECDGCGSQQRAVISYISPRAEFTPPIIYSERARAKLVFLVEARLPVSAQPLPLGLPVDVIPVAVQ